MGPKFGPGEFRGKKKMDYGKKYFSGEKRRICDFREAVLRMSKMPRVP
jgi:hypothetical protein